MVVEKLGIVKKFGWEMPKVHKPDHDERSFIDETSAFMFVLEHGVFDKMGKARKARGSLVCEDNIPTLTVPIHDTRKVYAICVGDKDFLSGFLDEVKQYITIIDAKFNHAPSEKNFGVGK